MPGELERRRKRRTKKMADQELRRGKRKEEGKWRMRKVRKEEGRWRGGRG